ncbi:hypothetical protein AB1L12_04635 [Peribacillus frigoritolerans]|uniref:hypothetical protein n=1 Tax=Peribacillus frigoritolerans TaxID=450367 RepID=UPI0039A3D2BA
MKLVHLALVLQVIYILLMTFFNFVRIYVMDHYSVYLVAFFELFLGIASFICGLLGAIKKESIGLSIIIMIFGLFICVFFVFIYLLGEAGIPPAIPWFYSE